jgi:hypothetical protein
MKEHSGFLIITAIIVSTIIGCTVQDQNRAKTGGPEKVDFRVLPFNLSDVKMLDGPLFKATQLNIKTLLAYEPDRLLTGFYKEAGLKLIQETSFPEVQGSKLTVVCDNPQKMQCMFPSC